MAQKSGGHGGMDFIMLYRLLECVREGLPPDMDVYDCAALVGGCAAERDFGEPAAARRWSSLTSRRGSGRQRAISAIATQA